MAIHDIISLYGYKFLSWTFILFCSEWDEKMGSNFSFKLEITRLSPRNQSGKAEKNAVFETLVYRYRCFPRSGFAAVFVDVGWRSININHLSFKCIFETFVPLFRQSRQVLARIRHDYGGPKGAPRFSQHLSTFNIFVQFPKGNQRQQLQIDGPPCMHIYIIYKHA